MLVIIIPISLREIYQLKLWLDIWIIKLNSIIIRSIIRHLIIGCLVIIQLFLSAILEEW